MNSVQLAPIDYGVIIAYLCGLLFLGLRYARTYKKWNIDSYLLAGRRVSLPAFTATLVSTWYGGVLGIGEFTYRYGILNWFTQALPYYVFAILFALILAAKIQKTQLYTIPDQLYQHYGKFAGGLGSLFVFILVTPAPYILMVVILLKILLGISFGLALVIAVFFSTLYVFWGGFQSVVKTDLLQFSLMFLGFIIVVGAAFFRFGGLAFLKTNLPATHLSLTGGQGWQYLFVWFFIALWTFIDPGFYQRCYAAKRPQTAKYGILSAVLFWMIFDALTTLSGLYARALFQDINPMMAFPLLGETVLPPLLRGLFFAGLLATIMSTLDSFSFLSAVTFGRDILWRLKQRGNINRFSQIGLVLSIIIAIVIIYLIPSIVRIWYTLGTLFIPTLIYPLLGALISRIRMSQSGTIICMLTVFITTSSWYISGVVRNTLAEPNFLLNIQPFFTGLLLASLIFIIDQIWQRVRG